MKTYKETHDLEGRKRRVLEIRQNYPDLIPIIVEKAKNSKLDQLPTPKYLQGKNIQLFLLKEQVKKTLKLDKQEQTVLYFYCGKQLVTDDQTIFELYQKFKDKEDGFLYIQYNDTDSFG